jgi:hypothetical protein
MTNSSPLPLYRVLVDEYNQQRVGPAISEDYVAEKLRQAKELFADIEDKEERNKKINSAMTAEFYKWLHTNKVKRSALCFSGGGIRSATFGLGILQGLARYDLVEKFDYLSTVSGGGYLGSWLSAWIHRRGLRRVQEGLKNSPPKSPLQPEPEPVRHLRSYSNYMSPKPGLTSADTWTLVAIYFRNLLLNWLVLIPLILAVLMVPRLSGALVALAPGRSVAKYIFFFAILLGIFAIGYIYANRPSLADPPSEGSRYPARRKTQGWFLVFCLVPLILLAVLITSYYAWLPLDISAYEYNVLEFISLPAVFAFVAFGVILNLGGLVVSLWWVRWLRWREYLVAAAGGLAGFLTWLVASNVFPNPAPNIVPPPLDLVTTALYVCFAPPLFLMLFLIGVTIFVGLASYDTTDADREWLARAGAWVLIASVVWSVVSFLVIFGPPLLLSGVKTAISMLTIGVLSGVVTLILGRSSHTAANAQGEDKGSKGGLSSLILPLAAVLFTAFILILLSFATTWVIKTLMVALSTRFQPPDKPFLAYGLVDFMHVFYYPPGWLLLLVTVVFTVIGGVAGWFININKFSLHAAYRDRLIRAYMGASRSILEREPNPFTGLDDRDNLQMHELRTGLLDGQSITDLKGLAMALRAATTPVSLYLQQQLSPSTQSLLERYDPERPDPIVEDDLRVGLTRDLNRITQGKSIYSESLFPQTTDEIRALLKQDPLVETLRLNRLLLELAYPQTFKSAEMIRPLHIVNATLNLVHGDDLAWQNRKAESFTFSPLHSGSYCIGYRDSRTYAYNPGNGTAITLGTACAISGAAASPNMGYHSSPLVTFLLTIFNVRLGWWLGNPGPAGNRTYNLPGPYFAAKPIVAEALGFTNDRHPYVYLSDGGHFENLGVYEMVLRRCSRIVVSDGSSDPDYTFEGLGNALSKIRVDFGVPILFDKILIFPRKHYEQRDHFEQNAVTKPGHGYCAIGRICYSCVDTGGDAAVEDGVFIYIKASLNGTEPADVYNYSRAHGAFPHESTGDQMYSEDQFESYRELGSHVISQICRDLTIDPAGDAVEQLFKHVESSIGNPPDCP